MKHSDQSMLDRVKGSIIAGAAGDALGYSVEFMPWRLIEREFGPEGIQDYELRLGHALFSDDTQMTLFTANGILMYDAHGQDQTLSHYVHLAYLDWLDTQSGRDYDLSPEHHAWLFEVPGLHSSRAPGITCINALISGKVSSIRHPLNDSKGCGGVMRVAPVALRYIPESDSELRELDIMGAEIAAITHGHPLGWLPAAMLTHIISRILSGMSIIESVRDSWKFNREIFTGTISEEYLDEMGYLMTKAERLSGSKGDDVQNIESIGGGWTGDEALAVAVYCALRYPEDFSQALIASVNHSGDSDSTGAVMGNILGASLGYEAIPSKWKHDLELKDILDDVSEDLCSCGHDFESKYMR